MTPGDYARFDWDTSRRTRQPYRAPAAPVADWLKVFLWTLGIIICLPVVLVGIGALVCAIMLASG